MKRTVFCAALLLAAGCSSPKKNRTVDPLRVETIVAAPSADVGAAVYVGAIEEVFGRLELPRRRDRRPHFCGRGPARRKGHLLAELDPTSARPDFRGRRSRAESGRRTPAGV